MEVLTETKIKKYDGRIVQTDKGDFPARLLLWTGGISGAALQGFDEGLVNKKGRIAADEYGRVKGHDTVFALGDVVQMTTEEYPNGHPQLAAVAVQQGRYLADYFLDIEQGRKTRPFTYKNRGVMANIGRKKGVIELADGRTYKGFLPWFAWLVVHLSSLTGLKNKMLTFFTWTWLYLSRDMAARITIERKTD